MQDWSGGIFVKRIWIGLEIKLPFNGLNLVYRSSHFYFFPLAVVAIVIIRPESGSIHLVFVFELQSVLLDKQYLIHSNYHKSQDMADSSNSLGGPLLVQHVGQQKHIKAGQYIKSAVYGGLDGIITTLCVALSGLASGTQANVILALGMSSLIGDAVAMGVADYLATKSDGQYMKSQEERERLEIQNDFEAEKKQMVHIYIQMGLEPVVAEQIVDILSQNKQGFLKVMMIQQLKLITGSENPFRNSLVTFFSFCIFGLMPLIPIIIAKVNNLQLGRNFIITTILVAAFFLFVLGFSKSFVTSAKWYISCLQTIVIGAISAGAAFGVGTLFGG